MILREDIEAFETSLATPDEATPAEKPLHTTERRTLLVLVAALARQAKFDLSARGINGAIARATEEIGAPVAEETVRRMLLQIPDAIEARAK